MTNIKAIIRSLAENIDDVTLEREVMKFAQKNGLQVVKKRDHSTFYFKKIVSKTNTKENWFVTIELRRPVFIIEFYPMDWKYPGIVSTTSSPYSSSVPDITEKNAISVLQTTYNTGFKKAREYFEKGLPAQRYNWNFK